MHQHLVGITLSLCSLSAALQAQQAAPASSTGHGIPGACFGGTGGPNGDFDWVVHTGELFFFDTTSTSIVGGPNGIPTTTILAQNGIVDLRSLLVEEGGEIRVQGPNPMRVLATGEVVIRGRVDLSGFNAHDVATLNTGNQVELGGAGAAGGGSGGNANPVTTGSSPRGEPGNGPFGLPGVGGQGGESGYAPSGQGKDARRPGGGGGGRFAADLIEGSWQGGVHVEGLSLAASAGGDGNVLSTGALSGTGPAQGGAAGEGAFTDPKPQNDFYGVRPQRGSGGGSVGLIRGELPQLWAGYGGGGGGNAIPASSFPNPNWNFASDEKGGAGGGAGGALQVQALGRIVFGAQGEILANGGRGGTGENTNFLDHVGGTGGAGSGGHIVLESATQIDFTDGGTNTSSIPRAWLQALGQPRKTGLLADVNACCRNDSFGGASGAGVIQLHTPDAVSPPGADPLLTDILVPASLAALRHPLAQIAAPAAFELLPTCDPFPRTSFGWFGGLGRRVFERIPLAQAGPMEESLEPIAPLTHELEIPRW